MCVCVCVIKMLFWQLIEVINFTSLQKEAYVKYRRRGIYLCVKSVGGSGGVKGVDGVEGSYNPVKSLYEGLTPC